ncbi:MAG: Xaa-Pro peptidase family protein [Nanoarchaeota archaeon]|nr:Xaa-Pro peptidase family protein [Nanoarchaeota archaeon]MBU1321111.1 Xaa-Pro peptidase family protein [Nanoarchaeota archaeon]MBU1597487.1 Xaa-Pro peptidase family protein [Nanoarchaeota archaeon]MBU2441325.1 Xaa-Pro peptidase family protein [Nanoarchaeota archaeon]
MKLSQVKKYLQENKLDAIVLFAKTPNFTYFVQSDFEYGIMVLTKKGNYLLVSLLYKPKFKGFQAVRWKNFKKDFKAFLKKHKIKKIGYDSQEILLKQKKFLSRHFKVRDVSGFLEDLRQTKTKEELAKFRKACQIGDVIFKKIISNLNSKKFKTEADIVKFMKMEALKQNAEMSFEPIVANAENGVVAHHEMNSRLKKGFLVMDFGIKYKGYLSDMTRTIYLGTPSKKEIEIYGKVLDIQKKCIEKAKIGMKTETLYNYSLKLFGKDAKYFVHGLGHGIGVRIHEKPSIGKAKDTLLKHSVFTIEPGYYNPKLGIGIRIEDDVYLGDKKEILTKSTKDLICLKLR